MTSNLRKLVLGVMLCGLAMGANAQAGGLGGIPVVGDLLGGVPMLGNAGGLPVVSLLADPQMLFDVGVSVLGDPQSVLGTLTGLGVPLVLDLVPVLDVLSSDPAGLPDFLFGGGTILTDTLGPIPSIPLLTAPL